MLVSRESIMELAMEMHFGVRHGISVKIKVFTSHGLIDVSTALRINLAASLQTAEEQGALSAVTKRSKLAKHSQNNEMPILLTKMGRTANTKRGK